MILEIFDKTSRTRVDLIRTYNYVTYKCEFTGPGSFEIKIPIFDESMVYLKYNNYILFDTGVVGIIKNISTSQNEDQEVTISGILTNGILNYRVISLTKNFYDTIPNIFNDLVDEHFISVEDTKRKISFISLSQNVPSIPGNVRYQNTGDTILNILSQLSVTYNLGFNLYPIVSNLSVTQDANLSELQFRIIKPVNRTVGNTEGNIPVVFSFELDNLTSLEYSEDSKEYCSIAYVAAEGTGQQRHLIEVGDLTPTGIDRIELYVDARDLQPEESGEELTAAEIQAINDELEEKMRTRGLEKLSEKQRFISFDGTINTGSMQYIYGTDFNLGDYVTIMSKELNLQVDAQIVSMTKSISNGVEYFDLEFGYDRLLIRKLFKRGEQ